MDLHAQKQLLIDIDNCGRGGDQDAVIKQFIRERKVDLSYRVVRQHKPVHVTCYWWLNADGSSGRAICHPNFADATFITHYYRDGSYNYTE